MQKEKFQEYLYSPESHQHADLSDMEQLTIEFPWFSTAAILLLICSKLQSAPDFDARLKKYTIRIPNRKQLQKVLGTGGSFTTGSENSSVYDSHSPDGESGQVQGENFTPPVNGKSALDDESLLEFTYNPPKHLTSLAGGQSSEDPEKSEDAKVQDAEADDRQVTAGNNSSNFDNWISRLGGEPAEHKKHEIIESFIKSEPGVIRADKETQLQGDIAKNSAEEHDGFITDTLARIYVKQGLYHKAIYAYEKLCLKYPEKSIYFAGQIEEIKSLYIKN